MKFNIDESSMLEVIDRHRNFDAVMYQLEKDEGLYEAMCHAIGDTPTDRVEDMKNTLIRYLRETVEVFDADDPENWFVEGCQVCLGSMHIA